MKPLKLTVDILVKCGAHRASAVKYVDLLNELLPYYKITTHLRLSHFLGQVLHESNGFRAVEEYDSGAAYEGRLDLGNTQPGDGIRYKGRGLIQTTGKSNYATFARKFGIDCVNHPELLEEPRWAVASALFYWGTRALNTYADKDMGLAIGQIINLGSIRGPKAKRYLPNGHQERIELTNRCKAALLPLFVTDVKPLSLSDEGTGAKVSA